MTGAYQQELITEMEYKQQVITHIMLDIQDIMKRIVQF